MVVTNLDEVRHMAACQQDWWELKEDHWCMSRLRKERCLTSALFFSDFDDNFHWIAHLNNRLDDLDWISRLQRHKKEETQISSLFGGWGVGSSLNACLIEFKACVNATPNMAEEVVCVSIKKVTCYPLLSMHDPICAPLALFSGVLSHDMFTYFKRRVEPSKTECGCQNCKGI